MMNDPWNCQMTFTDGTSAFYESVESIVEPEDNKIEQSTPAKNQNEENHEKKTPKKKKAHY